MHWINRLFTPVDGESREDTACASSSGRACKAEATRLCAEERQPGSFRGFRQSIQPPTRPQASERADAAGGCAAPQRQRSIVRGTPQPSRTGGPVRGAGGQVDCLGLAVGRVGQPGRWQICCRFGYSFMAANRACAFLDCRSEG